jgi:hypothetical protein
LTDTAKTQGTYTNNPHVLVRTLPIISTPY